jgi:CPA1 family monovalent cation:H+ antiporter
MPSVATMFVVAWTSMRGMVSLAAALALPLLTADGRPTPFRSEIVLVTVVVILVTLVLQGLTLLPFFSRLQLPADAAPALEEAHARTEARRAALEHLADLVGEPWVTREDLARVEAEVRQSYLAETAEGAARGHTHRRVRLATVQARRRALVRLRDEGAISDEVLLTLESELDYEALRLGAGNERDRSAG